MIDHSPLRGPALLNVCCLPICGEYLCGAVPEMQRSRSQGVRHVVRLHEVAVRHIEVIEPTRHRLLPVAITAHCRAVSADRLQSLFRVGEVADIAKVANFNRQPVMAARVAVDQRRDAEGASRLRARAEATASALRCTPSLAYRLRMWVLTVAIETDSSLAISGADR